MPIQRTHPYSKSSTKRTTEISHVNDKITQLQNRITQLEETVATFKREKRVALRKKQPKPAAISAEFLRDPISKRYDALRIAEFLTLNPTETARLLNVSSRNLAAMPDALSVQEALLPLVRLSTILLEAFGNQLETIQDYLSMRDPQLENKTPRQLIKEGKGQILAEMLYGMTQGQFA